MGARARYHYVDLLRGFAALVVIIFHYRLFYAQVGNPWRGDISLPLFSWLWPIYGYGSFSVRLFWALSGFVFVAAYGDGVSARTFWIHRFSRLYPLHLLTLLVVAALQVLSMRTYGRWTVEPHNDVRHFMLQLAFASNWFTPSPSFNGPIWSVSIEVLIYFVFLLYLKRFGLKLWVAVALIMLGAAGSLMLDSLVAQCLSLFFAGVVVAIVSPNIRNLLPLSSLAVGGVLALGAAMYWLGFGGHRIYQVTLYLGSPAILCLFVAFDREAPALPARWHWIGLSTYSVYLWHMPLLIAIKMSWGDWIPDFLANAFVLCLWVAVMAVIGVLSYRHFEAPAQTWLRDLLSSRPRTSDAQLTRS